MGPYPVNSHSTSAILCQEGFWLVPCQDPLFTPTGSAPFTEPLCESALISAGAAPKDNTDQETKRIHFIVSKTMAPVGRNTIIMLTAANTGGKG